MAHARIESLLHPAGKRVIGQQRQRHTLEVGHVDQAALLLERGVRGKQRPRQSHHAAMLVMGVLLGHRLADAVEHRADLGLCRQIAELLPGRARVGEECAAQCVERGAVVGQSQRRDEALRRLVRLELAA